MKKTIKTENYIKRFFAKHEMRYIKEQGWAYVLQSMVPAGCEYTLDGWARTANVKDITIHTTAQAAALEKAVTKRAKILKAKMPDSLEAYYKEEDTRIKNEKQINAMLKETGLHYTRHALNTLRTGSNTGTFGAVYCSYNGVECVEFKDYDGYSRSCNFTMVRRSFILHIRKGYTLHRVGGLLTFIKGKRIDRIGVACEWIEQGKAIADIRTVKGYLVKGEHIKAKSLKAAKAVNVEHRAQVLANILDYRKKAQRKQEQMGNGTLRITFADSLRAGNCRPGTMDFKRKYEEATGHEATDISVTDLMKYGKQFGVEYYAKRVIKYVLGK